MKAITLEEIYADPHVLEGLLTGRESVEIVQEGEFMGVLLPREKLPPKRKSGQFNAAEHRAWFFKTHGPDAYNSRRTTAEIFDELRRAPSITSDE